jgi:hypothetical protein
MNQRSPSASTVEFFNTIRQKRSFVIFGFGKYGDARIFSAGMGFPDTKWIEQIFEVGGD